MKKGQKNKSNKRKDRLQIRKGKGTVRMDQNKIFGNSGTPKSSQWATVSSTTRDDAEVDEALRITSVQFAEDMNRLKEKIEKSLMEKAMENLPQNRTIEVKDFKTGEFQKIESSHPLLELVLKHVQVGNLVYLVGPAGSGKTTLGYQVAEVLKREFYFTGAVHQKHELLGFIDAKGDLIRTPFREAYENGGVFLFDELDACSPHAVTPFNAALSNKQCAFPDKIIDMHEDFVAIAAGNTYGTGASRQYVGRYQQDAASLDRFVFIEVPYNTSLETTLVLSECTKFGGGNAEREASLKFLQYAHSIREVIKELELNHIVSPRATMMAARLYGAYGVNQDKKNLADTLIWKGISQDQKDLIQEALKESNTKGQQSTRAKTMKELEEALRKVEFARQAAYRAQTTEGKK